MPASEKFVFQVNRDRKAGDVLAGPRHRMESDFALAYPYAAMSHETIPAITTRSEHWPTSLITSGRESSSSRSLSPFSSTEYISSMSTDLIYVSCLCRWDRRVKWCAGCSRVCSSRFTPYVCLHGSLPYQVEFL